MADHTFSARARAKAQAQNEKAERDRKVNMFNQRMEIARAGIIFYQQNKFKEALDHYYKYFAMLERLKGVKSGMVEPKLFDTKKDVAEMLLISGIYWDIVRLQDRSKRKDAKDQAKATMEKLILFSKGMPYQHMCAELCRKYLMNDKPIHRAVFKDAHVRLGGGKCFIATAVEDYCAPSTLPSLRNFRDEYLLNRMWGRIFVRVYYYVGPAIARAVIRMPESIQIKLAQCFDCLAK